LFTTCSVFSVRRLPTANDSGNVTGAPLNSSRLVSAVGVMKSKVKWLPPTTSSFTTLLLGFQRQLAATFHGSRNVSTRHGCPGKGGEPRLTSSQIVFCAPLE
jgi:hypothetical protein